MALAPLLAALAMLACAPAGKPIVAEVYYDANGDDTGWEFVELFNPSAAPVALAGARLEAGDGALDGAPRATPFVHTDASSSAARRSRPVPTRSSRSTCRTARTPCGSSGPTARLRPSAGARTSRRVLAVARTAPDAPSASALTRVPDAADTGGNAGDFRVAAPTPGVANQSERDLAIVRGSLALSPAQPAPLGGASLSLAVIGAGMPVADGERRYLMDGDALDAPITAPLGAIESGDTLRVQLPVRTGFAGRATVRAAVALPGDEAPGNDADTLRVRVGEGPLEVTEIQFHPAQGEGEWIEVRNRSGARLALGGFTLGDRASAPARVTLAAELPAESLAVIVQDRAAFARAFPQLDTARVASVRGRASTTATAPTAWPTW